MEFLKTLEKTKLAGLAIAALTTVVFIIFLAFKLSSPSMAPIYSSLSTEDSHLISMKLHNMNVPFESSEDGTQILVPIDQVLMLRMNFAAEGIPSSAKVLGYEIFDQSDSMHNSQFVNNINLVRALEGELSRTIASINNVESARVHLVLPKKELFSKVGSDPSASIVIKNKGAGSLSKTEIAAISHLVSAAVPGLKTENITIIDTKGNPLKLNSEDDDSRMISSNHLDYQINLENRLKNMVEATITRYVGEGKVKANVSAEIDFDKEVFSSESYDPDSQVVRSKKSAEEQESDGLQNDNVSVSNNLPNAGGANQYNSKNKSRSDEIVNYEISRNTQNKVSESNKIKKLSVAVLVDGIYNKDPNTGELVYQQRSEDELNKLKTFIATAIGLDESRGDKIEVINLRFDQSDNSLVEEDNSFFNWIKHDIKNLVQVLIMGIVIILVILLIVRPIIVKMLDAGKAPDALSSRIPGLTLDSDTGGIISSASSEEKGIDLEQTYGEDKYASIIQYLNDTIVKHPEEAASIIRNWLYNNTK